MNFIIIIWLLVCVLQCNAFFGFFNRIFGREPLQREKETQIQTSPIGINNLSNTCYMNSILQLLYNCDTIRECVLNNSYGDSSVGKELHKIFSTMKSAASSNSCINTKILALLHNINISIQEDAHEYLLKLIEQVDESITITKENSRKYSLSQSLGGEFFQSINCSNVNFTKTRINKFLDLSVSVEESNNL